MKIGIDARMLGAGYGLGRYIEQLVLGLQELDNQNQYILFVRKPDERVKKNNFRQVLADIPWYGWAEQIKFLPIIKKAGVDLMHWPHWNIPFFYKGKFIVTIHDLIMFHFPRPAATTLGPLKFFIKDRAHRILVKRAAHRARHIIAASEFSKQDVHKTLRVPLDKMTVVYQAPHQLNPKSEIRNPKEILDKYNITKSYVMYVGAAYPHKNLKGLLQAWKIFENKYSHDYQLVLAGKESYFYNQLEPDIKNQQSVIYIGFVSDSELEGLYKKASLYVFPSLYEGFGLPPLEAGSHGIPVAASSSSSIPEVLGEGAAYFDPQNYEQMAEVIFKCLTDDNLRYDLKENLKHELLRYSSEKMARETLAVYKEN